jgi:hypothetical protein
MKKLKYRGENRYNEFLTAAKVVSKKVSKIKGVVGILATGGIGRGYCDDYSDLDLTVYVDDRKFDEITKYIAVGGLRYKGIEIDTPVESYQNALNQKSPSKYWSQDARWDRENSKILFDTDSRLKSLLKEKLVFPDWEQKKLLSKYQKGVETHLIYFYEMWQKRGSQINLADTLIRASKNIILWLYAKNKKFHPYLPKWLFYYLESDLIPESKFFSIIKKPFLESLRTAKEIKNIREELLELCDNIGINLGYKNVKEVFEKEKAAWEKAREKTKYYLSW